MLFTRLFLVSITILFSFACSRPVYYGYEPNGSREFWEQRPTQLMTMYPGIGDRHIEVNQPIRVTFSKKVVFTHRHITLYPITNTGRHITCKVEPYGDGRTFTLRPKEPLRYHETYIWKIRGVRDVHNIAVPDFSSHFQTVLVRPHVNTPKYGWSYE